MHNTVNTSIKKESEQKLIFTFNSSEDHSNISFSHFIVTNHLALWKANKKCPWPFKFQNILAVFPACKTVDETEMWKSYTKVIYTYYFDGLENMQFNLKSNLVLSLFTEMQFHNTYQN